MCCVLFIFQIPQRLIILSEPMYKPKLLLKSPSMRAIKNYNDLSIADDNSQQNTYDNLNFIPECENIDLNTYDDAYTASITSNSSDPKTIFPNDLYDYTTLGSMSVKTGTSTGSELESEKNEMGSTVKLVTSKMEMVSLHLHIFNLRINMFYYTIYLSFLYKVLVGKYRVLNRTDTYNVN